MFSDSIKGKALVLASLSLAAAADCVTSAPPANVQDPLLSSVQAVQAPLSTLNSLVSNWNSADGLMGALGIQQSYYPLYSAVQSLSGAAASHDPIAPNDVSVYLDSLNNLVSDISSLLANLDAKANDLAAVGASAIVVGDVTSLAGPASAIESKLFQFLPSDAPCPQISRASGIASSFSAAFASAAETFTITGLPALPSAPSACASYCAAGASSSADPSEPSSGVPPMSSNPSSAAPASESSPASSSFGSALQSELPVTESVSIPASGSISASGSASAFGSVPASGSGGAPGSSAASALSASAGASLTFTNASSVSTSAPQTSGPVSSAPPGNVAAVDAAFDNAAVAADALAAAIKSGDIQAIQNGFEAFLAAIARIVEALKNLKGPISPADVPELLASIAKFVRSAIEVLKALLTSPPPFKRALVARDDITTVQFLLNVNDQMRILLDELYSHLPINPNCNGTSPVVKRDVADDLRNAIDALNAVLVQLSGVYQLSLGGLPEPPLCIAEVSLGLSVPTSTGTTGESGTAVLSSAATTSGSASGAGSEPGSLPTGPGSATSGAQSGAPSNEGSATMTESTLTTVVTAFTTYCPEPTTFAQGNKTYTVTKATTLTITDCPCTLTSVVTEYVTYCPGPTTFTYGDTTYTITKATTLTIPKESAAPTPGPEVPAAPGASASPGAPAAPGAPASPGVPAAPEAPAPPGAPGAPSSPGAPNAPEASAASRPPVTPEGSSPAIVPGETNPAVAPSNSATVKGMSAIVAAAAAAFVFLY